MRRGAVRYCWALGLLLAGDHACTRRSNLAAMTRAFASSIRCAAHCRRARRIRALEARKTKSNARQLEAAEVARRVDREGYKQVERSLGDMQSQIARLNQDLSFYRGLGAARLAHPRQSAADADRAGRTCGPISLEVRADADRQAGQRGGGQRGDHASMG